MKIFLKNQNYTTQFSMIIIWKKDNLLSSIHFSHLLASTVYLGQARHYNFKPLFIAYVETDCSIHFAFPKFIVSQLEKKIKF